MLEWLALLLHSDTGLRAFEVFFLLSAQRENRTHSESYGIAKAASDADTTKARSIRIV